MSSSLFVFWVALVYAIILFVVVTLVEGGPAFVLTAIGLMMAVVNLCAAWVVLGPETLGRRLIITFSAMLIVAAGGGLGVLVLSGNPSTGPELKDVLFVVAPIAIYWLVAQIPFWLLRIARGWRLTIGDQQPSSQVSIVDMMVLTAVVAVSVSPLNFATSGISQVDNVSSISEATITGPNGTTTTVPMPTRTDVNQIYFYFWFATSIFVLINTLFLGLPAVYFTTRKKSVPAGDSLGGFAEVILYFIAFCFLITFIVAATVGPPTDADFAYVFVYFGAVMFYVSMPMAIAASNGLTLRSMAKRKPENVKSTNKR